VADRIRWGILGTGKIARILATAIAGSTEGRLVAVGSRDPDRAAELAIGFDAKGAGAYDDVIADPDVDVVYVAMHHPDHVEWAVRAAEAGKHVLCEKPLAVRRTDAAAIVEAARRNDVFLQEAFAYRRHPQTERICVLIREGAIGTVRAIDAVFGYDAGPEPTNYLLDPSLAGGSILDVGCYATSMSHLIAATALGVPSLEAIEVAGAAVFAPSGVDRSTAATLTFEGGVLARVACSIGADLDSAVRIDGSDGRMVVRSPWLPGRIGPAGIVIERWDDRQEIPIDEERDAYVVEVDAVSRSVRDGERSTAAMSWEDSLANMLTLDRWREAIGLRYPGD
jgi:predicted dehydrogenase